MPSTVPNVGPTFSHHARLRMSQRGLSDSGIELVREYGRQVFARGALYCFIGRKEVELYADRADLTGVEGVHVLLTRDGTVLTVYRNRAFHPRRYRKLNYRRARLRKAARRRWN